MYDLSKGDFWAALWTFLDLDKTQARLVFWVAETEFVVKIESGAFFRTFGSIFTQNLGITRERLLMSAVKTKLGPFSRTFLPIDIQSGHNSKRVAHTNSPTSL